MDNYTAIKIDQIGKEYVIGGSVSGDLRESFNHRFKSLFTTEKKDRFWALKDISFNVEQGDAIGIIGRNGAGKSTLLKILSRITEPTVGRFEMKGRVSSLLEVGTGFHPELSGRENVFLNGTILGMKRKEIASKFDQIVDFSGVAKFIDTPIKHYSSGMKVRLAFAVAAHLDPEILIIDEVLAVGDAEFQQKCLGKMGEVTREGRTVLFVSHNLEAITDLCNKGIFLKNGLIESTGTAIDSVNSYMRSFHESSEVLQRTFPIKKGSGYITQARFVTDKKTPNFEYNDKISFRFEYLLNEDLPDAELNVDLCRGTEKISMYFGREMRPGEKSIKGLNTVELQLPVGILNKGNYYLNLALHDNYRQFLDIQTEALSFNILNKHPRYADHMIKDPGVLNLDPFGKRAE